MKYAHTIGSSPAAWKLALLLAACLLATACASAPPVYQAAIQSPAIATVAPEPEALSVRELAPRELIPSATMITPLDYYEWAMAATPPELMAEQLRLTSRRSPADAVIDTVHLGILMGMSALASPESELAAIDLLRSIGESTHLGAASREYAIFADFLLAHLQQREDLRAATSHVVVSREELEELTRSNQLLQEKIEALTRLEEQLIEREQSEVQADADSEGAQR